LRALAAQLERVREEEGSRIARELHDELGSSLSGLRWDLEEFATLLTGKAEDLNLPALQMMAARMGDLAQANIRAVKRISSELRPSILDDLGIAEALDWQVKEFQARTGIVCASRLVCGARLNRDQTTAVFRITQEALTNILRHSNATKVEISMEISTHWLCLQIADNGRGITSEEIANPLSLGILGMRERARLLGGVIDISGAQGQGTTVTVKIPIHESEPEGRP